MTARVDLQSKVSVLPEPKVSYFSQYHAIVSRSIWDPVAPGILEGVKDLVGRVVIITTALACYLIVALLSIPYWYTTPPLSVGPSTIDQRICRFYSQKRIQYLCGPNDSCSVPHTHRPSDAYATLSVFKEKILQLCDIEKLQEDECIYTGDLTVEKNQIQLLMQDSKAKLLVDYILQNAEKRKVALGALFVLLGIKPALAIEEGMDEELSYILTNLTHKHLCLKISNGSRTAYFVNEIPFPSFDPRQFLNLSPEVSLTEAVALCFFEQNQRDADQFLSYLLGFGPSWETFAIYTDYLYQERNSVSCVFKGDHYYEIGKVLQQHLFSQDGERLEIEKLGFNFHSQFASLIGRCDLIKENFSAVKTMLAKTGTLQMLDGLTARTDYFKKSYTLKKWVMDTYFPQLL